MRLETGPVQMPDDWPGVFIRGDNAVFFAGAIERIVEALEIEDVNALHIDVMLVGSLVKTLRGCVVRQGEEPEGLQKIEFRKDTDDAAEDQA